MAGVERDGDLLLVAADGRAPGYSAGLDFEEESAVMRSLGARDALNLDGGGSTTMVIRGTMVTRPSDATGERPIGDAILVTP
jgi:exopolysaccharide biosynthesis protein